MLVLASASPRRLALLRELGIEPDLVVAMDIDETPQKDELPRPHALRLAKAKMDAAIARYPSQYIITGDTVIAVGRRILPKAETAEQVRQCLTLLSGRRHRAYTGLAVTAPDGTTRSRVSVTSIGMKRLTEHEMTSYADCGEGVGKAGGYSLQGRAGAFISFLSGSYTGVIGLPQHDTYQMLTGLGYFTGRL